MNDCVSKYILYVFGVVNVLLNSSVSVAVEVYLVSQRKSQICFLNLTSSFLPCTVFPYLLAETGEGAANGFAERKAEEDQKTNHI